MIPRGKLYISYKEVLLGMIYCIADLLKLKKPLADSEGQNDISVMKKLLALACCLSSLLCAKAQKTVNCDSLIKKQYKIAELKNNPQLGFSDENAAEIVEVSVEFAKKVRSQWFRL